MKKYRLSLSVAAVAGVLFGFQNCGQIASQMQTDSSSLSYTHSDLDGNSTFSEDDSEKTSAEPVMTDRFYVVNLITDVFGTQALTDGDVLNQIGRDYSGFGAPCSVYQNYYVEKDTGKINADIAEDCDIEDGPSVLGARINSSGTVRRQAVLMKVCANITANDTDIKYALKKFSSEAIPAPTEDNVRKMIKLFYRGKPDPSASLVDSIRILFTPESPTLAQWKSAVYLTCSSPQWQVL